MIVRRDRIARVQARMREEGLVAIAVLNHDDHRFLFGADRTQPRAVIPVEGAPTIIAFAGEEPGIRASLAAEGAADGDVLVFGSVGGQIHDVTGHGGTAGYTPAVTDVLRIPAGDPSDPPSRMDG